MRVLRLTTAMSVLLLLCLPALNAQQVETEISKDDLRAKAESLLKQKAMNLVFEENLGQYPEEVLFVAEGSSGRFILMKDGIAIMTKVELSPDEQQRLTKIKELQTRRGLPEFPAENISNDNWENYLDQKQKAIHDRGKVESRKGHNEMYPEDEALMEKADQWFTWKYNFVGMNPEASILTLDTVEQAGYRNYLIGNLAITHIRSFREIRYLDLYPGIDLRIYGDGGGGLKYDMIVYPGVDPSIIELELEGIDKLELCEKGDAQAITNIGRIRIPHPYSYQEIEGIEKEVPFKYDLKNRSLRFRLDDPLAYDRNKVLIIDPMVLDWSMAYGQYILKVIPLEDGTFVIGGRADSKVVTTPGAFSSNTSGSFITKFSPEGQIIWSTGIPGFAYGVENIEMLQNGMFVLMGYHSNLMPPLPVPPTAITNEYDVASASTGLIAISADGTSAPWGTYINSNSEKYFFVNQDTTITFILSSTSNDALPVTSGCRNYSGGDDQYVMKIRDGNTLLWGTYFGGTGDEYMWDCRAAQDGSVYSRGSTSSSDFPITPLAGQPLFPASYSFYVAGINGSNGQLKWGTYLGDANSNWFDIKNTVDLSADGSLLVSGMNVGDNFPLTSNAIDNSNPQTSYYGNYDYGITGINTSNGSFLYSTYLGGSGYEEVEYVKILPDNSVVILGNTISSDFPVRPGAAQTVYGGGGSSSGAGDLSFSRILPTGALAYSSYWGGPGQDWMEYGEDEWYGHMSSYPSIGPDNRMWIAASEYNWSPLGPFPTTPFAAFSQTNAGGVLFSFDIYTGEIKMSTYVPVLKSGSNPGNQFIIPLADTTCILYGKTSPSYDIQPTRDAIQPTGAGGYYDLYFGRFGKDGELLYSTFAGSSTHDYYQLKEFPQMVQQGNSAMFWTNNAGVDFPLTLFPAGSGGASYWGKLLHFTWDAWYTTVDTAYPKVQLACRHSNVIDPIFVPPYKLDLDRNGLQAPVYIQPEHCQWQFSLDSLTWNNIPGATLPIYQPQPTGASTWFRRLVLEDGNVLCTSTPAKLEIRPFNSPSVDPGDNHFLCPFSATTLGGSPAATGGAPPYEYAWSPSTGLNDSSLANPSVSLPSGIVGYTLIVTDTNDCSQQEQVSVEIIQANAGPDRQVCAGQQIVLTAPGYPGATNVNYTWSATDGSGNASILSPASGTTIVIPMISTHYSISVDDGGIGGGVCPNDEVFIEIVAPPIANAGPDRAICEDEEVVLGAPGLGGQSYQWTPGSHINSVINPQTTYDGSFPPAPNYTRTYIQTAVKTGVQCPADYDTVIVYVGFAVAGPDGCGPRHIGEYDFTGGIASYHWEVIYGDTSSILGKHNLAQPFVNPGITTLYELTVSINGVSCTDEVLVPNCGCPRPVGEFHIPVFCSSYDQDLPYQLYPGNVDTANYYYEWTGGDTSLMDNPYTAFPNIIYPLTNPESYLLVATAKADSSIQCSGTIILSSYWGNPPLALVATDTVICPENSQAVHLGYAPIVGLSYKWSPVNGLDNDIISDPLAMPDTSTNYRLVVEDPLTRCMDTAYVNIDVRTPYASAGPDMSFCQDGSFIIGDVSEPGMSYAWQPSQFVDDSTSSQPVATIHTNGIQLFLTVMDQLTGCIDRDTIAFWASLPFSANAGPDQTICEAGPYVLLGSTDSSAYGATYSWIPPSGLDDPHSPTPLASPGVTTTYTLIVAPSASQGCEATDQVTVSVTPAGLLAVNAGGDTMLCPDMPSVQIGPAPQTGMVYEWSDPDSTLSQTNVAQPFASPTRTTTYIVSVEDTVNCLLGTDTIIVEVSPLPLDILGGNQSICLGELVVLGSQPIPNASYLWTPATGLDAPASPNPIASPLSTSTYHLRVELNGCIVEDDIIVNVSSLPTANAGPDKVACGPVQIGTSAMYRYSYLWTPSTGLNYSNRAQPLADPVDTTTYILRTKYQYNSCYNYDTVVVYPTTIVNAGSDQQFCKGDGSQFKLGTPAKAGYTYSWSPATGLDDPNVAQPMASPSATTTYTLTATYNGCSKTDQVTIIVLQPQPIQIHNPGALCTGSCVDLFIDGNATLYKDFVWIPGYLVDDPSIPTPQFCAPGQSQLILEAVEKASGCPVRDTLQITVNDALTPVAFTGNDTILCYGESLELGIDGPDSLIYQWSPMGAYSPSSVYDHPTVTPASSTTYSLTVTNPDNGCVGYDQVNVDVVLFDVELDLDEHLCAGDAIKISLDENLYVNGLDKGTYYADWSPSTGVSDPAGLEPVLIPTSTTVYNLVITDIASGCSATDAAEIIISNTARPFVSMDPGIMVCVDPGDSIQIGPAIPPGGFPSTWIFDWSESWWPEGLSDLSVSHPFYLGLDYSDYWVNTLKVTDTSSSDAQCNSAYFDQWLEIVEPAEITPFDAQICIGDTVQLSPGIYSEEPSTDDDWGLEYSWTPVSGLTDPLAESPFAFPLISTNYVLTVKTYVTISEMYSANQGWYDVTPFRISGCPVTAMNLVTVNPLPLITPPSANIACGSLTERIIPLLPNNNFTYSWSPPSLVSNPNVAGPWYVGITDTVLDLTLTNKYGCQNTFPVNVLFGDTTPPYLFCPSDQVIDCTAETSAVPNGSATAADNCDNNPLIWHTDNVVPGICGLEHTILRTWFARDSLGNTRQCTQMILVQDTFAPVITCPVDVVLDCPADTSVQVNAYATATDICGPLPVITYSDMVTYGCGNSFTVARTWRATDDCGNYSECIQTLTAQDTIAPLIICPQDVVLNCPADTSVMANGFATATDECSVHSISYSDVVTYGCGNTFTVNRMWRATDDCGNFSECVQLISVQDTINPLITCPVDTTVTAAKGAFSTFVSLTQPLVLDECDAWNLENNFTGTSNASGIYPAGMTSVNWVATDLCGNQTSCTQNIWVQTYPIANNDDTIAPTGAALLFEVLHNDFDSLQGIDSSCVSILTNPNNGIVHVNPNNGSITYAPLTPTLNYADSFIYVMCNEFGLHDTALVSLRYLTPPTATIMGGGTICKYNTTSISAIFSGQPPWSFALTDGTNTSVYSGINIPLWGKFVGPPIDKTYTILWVEDATTIRVPGTGAASVTVISPIRFNITGGGTYNQGDPGKVIGLNGSQIGVEYQLMLQGTPVGVPVQGTSLPISFGYQTTPGIYSVEATDANTSCNEYMLGAVEVIMNPQPALCILSGGGICCMGCYNLEINLDCSETGIYYELYRNGIPTGDIIIGNGAPLVWNHINSPGTYTVRATNPITTATILMSGSAWVQFFPLPEAFLSGNANIIEGQSTTLQIALNGSPPFTLALWNGVNETIISGIMSYHYLLTVSPSDTTTYLVNWVTDSAGCGDQGYGSATVNVTPLKFGSISGAVYYANSNTSALQGIELRLKDDQGMLVAQTNSAGDGGYSFAGISPGTYTIEPNSHSLSGGINATDALLSIQHFSQFINLTPVALKAADVNASGFVNATDAFGIAQYFVNPLVNFASGNWAFLAPSVTIPPDGSSQLANIQALCYGDVDASFNPTKSFGLRATDAEESITLDNQQILDIPVYTNESLSASAISLSIEYPVEFLAIMDIILGPESQNQIQYHTKDNSLRISWYDLAPIAVNPEEPLLWIRVKVRTEEIEQAMNLVFMMSSESEIANDMAQPIKVSYRIPKLIILPSSLGISAQPNPFSQMSRISFTLPENGKTSILLHNNLGQIVAAPIPAQSLQKGTHHFDFDALHLPAGIYTFTLRLENEKGILSKSLRVAIE